MRLVASIASAILLSVLISSCSRESPTSEDVGYQVGYPEAVEPREQEVEEVQDWCTRENVNDGTPETCTCGVESPKWVAEQASNKGHRVTMDLERDDEGRILKATVKDYFMPDNGDAFSGFANWHVYYSSIHECRGKPAENPSSKANEKLVPTSLSSVLIANMVSGKEMPSWDPADLVRKNMIIFSERSQNCPPGITCKSGSIRTPVEWKGSSQAVIWNMNYSSAHKEYPESLEMLPSCESATCDFNMKSILMGSLKEANIKSKVLCTASQPSYWITAYELEWNGKVAYMNHEVSAGSGGEFDSLYLFWKMPPSNDPCEGARDAKR